MGRLSVISGGSLDEMARKISRKAKGNFVRSEIRVFADGESKITLRGEISKQRSVVVQSVNPPVDTNLVRTLLLVAKARETSARVTAVIPYMGYARQDREFLSGEVVTIRHLARLLEAAGASEVIMVDIHSTEALGHFNIRTKNISAIPELARHFKRLGLADPVVVSPDKGGSERAGMFAKELGLGLVVLEKKRDRKTGKVRILTRDAGAVAGRDLILVDDMISTGGSIIKATEFLKKQGCGRVYVACTHALLVGDAAKKIRAAGVAKIISANTVPGKTAAVDMSGAIAREIWQRGRDRRRRPAVRR